MKVRGLVSDRARALVKLGDPDLLDVCSMPDLFHFNQMFVSKTGTVIGKAYQKALVEYEKVKASGAFSSVRKPYEDKYLFLKEKRFLYRKAMDNIHKVIHPFTPRGTWQTGGQIQSAVRKSVSDIEQQIIWTKAAQRAEVVSTGPIETRMAADSVAVQTHLKINDQLTPIVQGVSQWQEWTRERVDAFISVRFANFADRDVLRQYLSHCLLPWLYWQEILKRTPSKERHRQLRADYAQYLSHSAQIYVEHTLTKQLSSAQMQSCVDWGEGVVRSFQRSSSQVEGRNGYLAFVHKANRGIPTERLKVLTVVHNYDTRRSDGSTPAQRLFRRDFADLFEHILENVTGFKEPRTRRASD